MKYPIQKKRFKKRLKKRRLKPIPRIIVPSFFTLMNLFCGFLSILMVYENNLMMGAWLIVLAGMFDVLDGFMARLANATSEFGVELDSISDMVSFGVAPGVLIYSFVLHELGIGGILLSALAPICASIRLARFNVESKLGDYEYFRGLPSPSFAIMLAAFYLTFMNRLDWFDGLEHGVISIFVPIVILLSFLMVSTVPFDKIPKKFDRATLQQYKGRLILIGVYFIIIVILQDIGLMIVFSFFILKGLTLGLFIFWKQAFTNDPDPLEEGL